MCTLIYIHIWMTSNFPWLNFSTQTLATYLTCYNHYRVVQDSINGRIHIQNLHLYHTSWHWPQSIGYMLTRIFCVCSHSTVRLIFIVKIWFFFKKKIRVATYFNLFFKRENKIRKKILYKSSFRKYMSVKSSLYSKVRLPIRKVQ